MLAMFAIIRQKNSVITPFIQVTSLAGFLIRSLGKYFSISRQTSPMLLRFKPATDV